MQLLPPKQNTLPDIAYIEEGSENPVKFVHEPDRPRGLKQYCSSPGKNREFFGTYGAAAFWWHIGRPDVVDLSIGLLDQRVDGVRAEEGFSWHKGRLAFMEKALATREMGYTGSGRWIEGCYREESAIRSSRELETWFLTQAWYHCELKTYGD